jgi:hypothetical protein
MAQLPGRPSARNITLVDPSREFEDVYDRIGRLMRTAAKPRHVEIAG